DHLVDVVLELGHLPLRGDGDRTGEVALGHSGGDLGNGAQLGGEGGGQLVHVLGQALPRAGHALDLGLTAQASFGAYLLGHAGDLGGERGELVDHGVDGVLELQDLAACVHGDLLGQVALGHGRGDLGDASHLAGEVSGHEVDVVGEVLPRARHALHTRLTTELAVGAHLPRDSGDLVGERRQLVDHGVDGVLQLEDLALDVDGDLLGQVALSHGGRDLGDVADLAGEVGGQEVHVVGEVLPCPRDTAHLGLTTELAFG